MANPQHLEILRQGCKVWNTWREAEGEMVAHLRGASLRGCDLSNVDLTGANLYSADLTEADLSGANLRGADLTRARMSQANLANADLSHAIADRANFSEAVLTTAILRYSNLTSASLCEADLLFADLRGTNLHQSNFEKAEVGGTTFCTVDLSEAQNLATVRHIFPSTIGLDTVFMSKGRIPEVFLRGCGVPESFITQMHSLVSANDGIQFYSCFISYSARDENFAKRLHGSMRDAHLRVWFAPEDIQGGKKLHDQIDAAIRIYDKLLIVLSDASLRSEWVMDELRKGFKAETDSGKRKLFPVRLTDYETLERWVCRDSISGKDLAEEIRQYFIPDFSHWKEHDQFETAFDRLLKDLRSEERSK